MGPAIRFHLGSGAAWEREAELGSTRTHRSANSSALRIWTQVRRARSFFTDRRTPVLRATDRACSTETAGMGFTAAVARSNGGLAAGIEAARRTIAAARAIASECWVLLTSAEAGQGLAGRAEAGLKHPHDEMPRFRLRRRSM